MSVLILFFLSGATALVYEVIWSKYLSQMFGSTVQAQTIVLAVFMGGLALGNRLLGKWSGRIREPLATYGYLELGIGSYALLFPLLNNVADAVFVTVGRPLLEHSLALLLVKGLLSVVLLLLPTVMMGGTLPLLADWLSRHTDDASRRSARFYSTNSLGAVTGAGFAGFYLIRHWGLEAGLSMAAVINIAVGIAAIGISGKKVAAPADADEAAAVAEPAKPATETAAKTEDGNPPEPATAAPTTAAQPSLVSSGCLLVALTGAVSMGLEVISSRFLTLIFGASTYAFAIVLMAFILGIGIGAAIIASPRFHSAKRERTTIYLLLAAATLVGVFLWTIEWWVEIYRVMREGLATTETGYAFHQLMISGISLIVLGIPAGLLGAVLPLWIRIGPDAEQRLGEPVGRLLTWNTVGAVVGVLITGFVLMPTLGLRSAFGILALVLCLGALLIATGKEVRNLLPRAAIVSGLVLLTIFTGQQGWRLVVSSGVFRANNGIPKNRHYMKMAKEHLKLLYYKDAADATVCVEQGDGKYFTDQLTLRVNGKPDASTSGDMGTQYLLAHLPMLARPESKDVFVLGFGSGITAGALLGHPVERIDIAENCGPVLEAGELFAPWNRDVLNAPQANIWREDARTILKLTKQQYDVIISEPSNPWMVGVGSVFSHEFYELAKARLKDGGIMTQWFHMYEMHNGIVEMILRTFSRVFPVVEIWDTGQGDIVMLGSTQPWETGVENFAKVLAREEPRRDLEEIGLTTPESIWARQLASQRSGFAIPDNGGIQSDKFPVLEYEAPKAFYLGEDSDLLTRFDERTWQADLAPAAKFEACRGLSEKLIALAFRGDQSVNEELADYLKYRYPRRGMVVDGVLFSHGHPLPSIFHPLKKESVPPPPADSMNPHTIKMLAAEATLLSDDADWREALADVVQLLDSIRSGEIPPPSSSVMSHFAGTAIRRCIREGDMTTARQVAKLSEGVATSHDMRYLTRMLSRPLEGEEIAP